MGLRLWFTALVLLFLSGFFSLFYMLTLKICVTVLFSKELLKLES